MQVDVVVSEALLGGQPGPQPAVRRLADPRLVQAERRQQRGQAADLVLVGGRDLQQALARARHQRRYGGLRAHRGCF